ncbi:MAG: hypothetical protein HKP43_04135 [Altererythrobacter sp.]|nr:NAD(+)/NADH kinase [Altererythrobacter sp.]NNF93755.1 hypothetical protein [Altererythrobacter sp.]NNK45801.1 hypothetical protein [Altererythrobacter sp.]
MAGPIHEFSHLPRPKANVKSAWRVRRDARAEGDAPIVGLIYNPRSHHNRGQDLTSKISPDVFVAQPGNRDQLPEALARLAERGIDLLVINGGDGTVRDVLTCGEPIFGDDWPVVAVLPKGKTNALAADLGGPSDWTLQCAVDAYENGKRIKRSPMAITPLDQPDARVLGFILGAGAFTLGTKAGQSAHKLGAFNSLAVGVTTFWGILQAVFGTRANPWRRGAKMDLRLAPNGVPLEHSGLGEPERRLILLASTLERFPGGIKPFGSLGKGLKLAALDQISRLMTLMLPAILFEFGPRNLRKRGFHQLVAQSFEMELDGQFILDGEAFPAGRYRVDTGPEIEFVAP